MQMNRQARIERILNEPLTGPLARATTKRVLAFLAVTSSWVYFLTLFPANYIEQALPGSSYLFRTLASMVMLGTFVFLRRSVRHITSVPTEYLDERQLLNRRWAYSAGYLVVRRVGLVLSIAFIGFLATYKIWNQIYYATVPDADPVDPVAERIYRSATEYFKAYFAIDPLQASGSILLLLTYVAYSFPIILLAWREAKTIDLLEIKEIENLQWLSILTRGYKGYFVRFTGIFLGIFIYLVVLYTQAQNLYELIYLLFFGTVFYALYVYTWGMVNQWQAITLLRSQSKLQEVRKPQMLLFIIFIVLSLVGVSILVVMLSTLINPISDAGRWNYSFLAGLVLVALHLFSFAYIRKIVRDNSPNE